ncbi:RelA/SpoT family protein, partial [Patescibacteria group bacterium]|nr:RelA/SpoT family protein [Patescibacteria group bacterium]
MPQKKSDGLELKEIIKEITSYLPKFDSEKFKKAFGFAKSAHKGQKRKDDSPYIVHPVATASVLADLHADEDTLIAALLHDVPEDTKKTIEDIEKTFGKQVSFLVDGITKLSKVYYRHDMAERQVESLKKLLIHSAKDPRVILIKLADRLHNMRTLKHVRPDKQMRIAKETKEIYVPMANLFGLKELSNELQDLCFYHLYPEEYRKVVQKIDKSNLKLKSLLGKTLELIKKELKKEKITADLTGRTRSLHTIFKKLKASSKDVSKLEDVILIRIITNKPANCYRTLGIAHTLFKPKTGMFKDYIAMPKSNGYQSLHTTVFGFNGVSTEIQIRTQRMHEEAEYGILSRYFAMRKGKTMKLDKDSRAKWVDKILEIQKVEHDSIEFIEDLKQDIFEDRIFVFTPKGDSIDLPRGATCIDLAYAIHSDIGHCANGAEVNGTVVPLTTTLKTGDIVKIKTGSEKSPHLYWLDFAKTNVAKQRIREFLSKESGAKKIHRGRNILNKELESAGIGFVEDLNFKKVQQVMRNEHDKFFETKNDLLVAVGEGSVKPITIANIFLKEKTPAKKLAKSVRVGIQVLCEDRVGLLRDLTNVAARFSLNLCGVKAFYSRYMRLHFVRLQFDVDSYDKLSQLLKHMERVEGVHGIVRVFPWRHF